MFFSDFVFTQWKNGYGIVTRTNKNETYELFSQLLIQFRESILNIARIDDHIYLHKALKRTYIAILSLSNAWKQGFRQQVQGWEEEADANIERIKQKRAAEYWADHPEERTALETEKSALREQIAKINDGIKSLPDVNSLPESSAVEEIRQRIAALNRERSGIGLFKIKERNEVQNRIDDAYQELMAVKEEEMKKSRMKPGGLRNKSRPVRGELKRLRRS